MLTLNDVRCGVARCPSCRAVKRIERAARMVAPMPSCSLCRALKTRCKACIGRRSHVVAVGQVEIPVATTRG